MTSYTGGNLPPDPQQPPGGMAPERDAQPDQSRDQFFAPGGPVAAEIRPQPQPAAEVTGTNWLPQPAGQGTLQGMRACPNCGQAWTGSQSCTFCGQVWGLPNGIVLSSAGRRLGEYLLEGLLAFITLGIGWIIWSLIVWTQGQTPAKQVLGMRVVRLDERVSARWGRMFLREFVGKLIVGVVSSLLFGIGAIVADCWLLWDKDRQELWDKIAGTVVVNDPDKRLAPVTQTQAA